MRGKPDVWVARCIRVILFPSRSGITTVSGRNFSIGSSRLTSPFPTMSARIIDVNTFVIDPISKSVFSSIDGSPGRV